MVLQKPTHRKFYWLKLLFDEKAGFSLYLDETVDHPTHSVSFLGLFLDVNFSFYCYIKHVSKKHSSKMFVLSNLKNIANIVILVAAYYQIINPQLAYTYLLLWKEGSYLCFTDWQWVPFFSEPAPIPGKYAHFTIPLYSGNPTFVKQDPYQSKLSITSVTKSNPKTFFPLTSIKSESKPSKFKLSLKSG